MEQLCRVDPVSSDEEGQPHKVNPRLTLRSLASEEGFATIVEERIEFDVGGRGSRKEGRGCAKDWTWLLSAVRQQLGCRIGSIWPASGQYLGSVWMPVRENVKNRDISDNTSGIEAARSAFDASGRCGRHGWMDERLWRPAWTWMVNPADSLVSQAPWCLPSTSLTIFRWQHPPNGFKTDEFDDVDGGSGGKRNGRREGRRWRGMRGRKFQQTLCAMLSRVTWQGCNTAS
jgi:hypothetical protein